MTVLAAFLGELDDTKKALTALVGAASFGFVVAVALTAFMGLPDQVAANTEFRVEHTRDFEALVCVITLPDSIASDRDARTRACGL